MPPEKPLLVGGGVTRRGVLSKQPVTGVRGGRAPATGLQAAAEKMSEKELERHMLRHIRDIKKLGIPFLKFHAWGPHAQKAEEGFPDYVLVSRRAMAYRELKRQDKDPTPAQRQWLDMLTALGVDAGVWKPLDWLTGRVGAELNALAGIGGGHG